LAGSLVQAVASAACTTELRIGAAVDDTDVACSGLKCSHFDLTGRRLASATRP
jgi:hypothetical protein